MTKDTGITKGTGMTRGTEMMMQNQRQVCARSARAQALAGTRLQPRCDARSTPSAARGSTQAHAAR
ncbi:hypothetical protein B1806_05405 [Metallibacterium scheffleri]|uniref:Uncharacterized protein n=1 Tax=Metallibacterium scheffleri TaxID=993689 RepID=A0A4S3KPQ0_9GAMM|nr:hypothetical protein B1806_05405 [Metallibacterium scheffleri]